MKSSRALRIHYSHLVVKLLNVFGIFVASHKSLLGLAIANLPLFTECCSEIAAKLHRCRSRVCFVHRMTKSKFLKKLNTFY